MTDKIINAKCPECSAVREIGRINGIYREVDNNDIVETYPIRCAEHAPPIPKIKTTITNMTKVIG